ncbi:MAG: sensor histidine kinase [Cyclobacteriaceae bacterium]
MRQYSTVEGLPNNAVRALHVDSRGLLWIGTENGLSKMENGTFRNFFESDGLAFNSVWAIGEDHLNQMWFGSYGGGLTMFDGRSFHIFNTENGLIDDRIRHLYSYQDKMLVGTENGISIIHVENGKVESLPETQRDAARNYTSGFFESTGRLFYTTYRHGVYEIIFHPSGTTVKKIHDHAPIYALGHLNDKIFTSNKGHVDVFEVEKFIAANPKQEGAFGQSVVWSYIPGPEQTVFGTAWGIYQQDGGLFVISENNMKSFKRHTNLESRNFISGVYDQETQSLFVGTTDKGLFKITLNESVLFSGERPSETKGFAGSDKLEAILYEDGLSLVESGKFLKNSNFKEAQESFLKKLKYPLPKHEEDFFELNYDMEADDMVFYSLLENNSLLWVNTNIGIFGISKEGEFIEYVPIHSYVIGFNPENELITNHPYGGLRIFDDLKHFRHRYFAPEDPLTPTQLAGIIQSDTVSYFASVFSGLYSYSRQTGFRSFLDEGTWEEKKFKTIHRGENGKIFLGGEFGDLFIYDPRQGFGNLETIAKDKIVGNGIIFIETFKDAIFIGTETGLNIYQEGTVRFFNHEQGLGSGLISSAKVIGETLYIGYDKGYYTIKIPEIMEQSMHQHNLEIREILVNNKPYGTENSLWFTFGLDKISLKNSENTLSIEFKPIGHPYPQKLLFRYRLHDDENWSPYASDNNITLASLSHGRYQLEIETLDLHSGKSVSTVILELYIAAPFYLRWWFVLGLILFLAATIIAVFRWRIQQERERAEIRENIVKTKLEALRSHMNPHFIFNAVNSIQYYILGNQGDEALDFLGKFSKLMRKTLENSIQPHIRLKSELDYLNNYIELENKRVNNKVTYKMEVPSEIDPEHLHIPSMLIQPFVENVFVHAFCPDHPDPQLLVSFSVPDEGMITCAVWDNGRGIKVNEKESLYKSRGMDLVRERLSLLPGYNAESIKVFSNEDKGTEVLIRIPCFYK